MIDNLTLLLSHGLILLTCWRLLSRPDLDNDHPNPDSGLLIPRARASGEQRPENPHAKNPRAETTLPKSPGNA